jgi:hypothetical protein
MTSSIGTGRIHDRGLDLNPNCDVCGKKRSGHSHTLCAKARQKRYAHGAATRSGDMTLPQRVIVDQLKAEGFVIDKEENNVVRMKRGNDYRLVRMDGSQKRALGAK